METILGYDCQKRLRFSETAGEAWLATKGDAERIILYIIPKTEENALHIQTIQAYAELLNRLPAEQQQNLLPILTTTEEDGRFLCTTPVADSYFTDQMAEISRSNQQILAIAETLAQTLLTLKNEHFTHIALTPDNLFYKGGILMLGIPTPLYTEPEFWPPESTTPFQADTDLYSLGKLLYSLDTGLPAKLFPTPASRETKTEIPALLLLWSHLSAPEPHARQLHLPTILKTIQDIRSDLTGEKPRHSLFPKKWLFPLEIAILLCGIALYCYTRFHSPEKYRSIFEAIAHNDLSGVRASIWNRGDVNALDKNLLLPIQVALRQKSTPDTIIETIIREGGCRDVSSAFAAIKDIIATKRSFRFFGLTINVCNYSQELLTSHGNEILHCIIEHNYDPKALQKLLNNATSIDTTKCDANGLSPLLKALLLEENEHCRILLTVPESTTPVAPDGMTPLHLLTDSTELLQRLLELKLDVNATTADGSTPLLLAVRKRRAPAIIQGLLQHQANPNAADNWGNTPLSEAVRNGDLETAKMLVEAGAASSPAALLRIAVLTDRTEILAWLLELTKQINLPDSTGRTPLHWAAFRNHAECVKLLLAAQAKTNLKDNLGLTPADLAFIGNATEAAALLPPCKTNEKLTNYRNLILGATPTPYPEGPASPDILATLKNENATEEELLKATEEISTIDQELVNAAINHPSTIFLNYLLQRPISSLDEALLAAAAKGNFGAVSLLCRAGADLNAATPEGKTSLELAIMDAHYRTAHILMLSNPDFCLGKNTDQLKKWQEDYKFYATLPDPAEENITDLSSFLRVHLLAGNTAAVRYTLPRYKLSANFQTSFGTSAIAEGSIPWAMMKTLLENGANPELSAFGQQNALQRSVAIGQPLAFQKLLLDYGANPNVPLDHPSPLLLRLLAFYAPNP